MAADAGVRALCVALACAWLVLGLTTGLARGDEREAVGRGRAEGLLRQATRLQQGAQEAARRREGAPSCSSPARTTSTSPRQDDRLLKLLILKSRVPSADALHIGVCADALHIGVCYGS